MGVVAVLLVTMVEVMLLRVRVTCGRRVVAVVFESMHIDAMSELRQRMY